MCNEARVESEFNTVNEKKQSSSRSTSVQECCYPEGQKTKRPIAPPHNHKFLGRAEIQTLEYNFSHRMEKHANRKAHRQIFQQSPGNLSTTSRYQSASAFNRRSSDFSEHKFWIKGWKRFDVKIVQTPSPNNAGAVWMLKIKDMDDTHCILDQLKEVGAVAVTSH